MRNDRSGECRAREILRLYLVEGLSVRKLANRFRMSVQSVYAITTGRNYPHLSRDPADYPDAGESMTAEEVEALVNERYQTMPRESRYPDGEKLPLAVIRGRGVMASGRKLGCE